MSLKARIIHSQLLLDKARQAGATRLAVMVSSGRDSACLAHMVHRSGIPATYINLYIVPGLEIVEEPLQALESQLGIKIVRIPNPRRRQMLDGDFLCINRVWDAKFHYSPPGAAYYKMIAGIAKTDWLTTGIARADSPRRRLSFMQAPNPNANSKRVYPMEWWRAADVTQFVKENKIVLSKSYVLQGRSFEMLSIARIYPMKHAMPEDYRKICNDFPLMDALCWLYEKRVREYGAANLPVC